MDASPWGFGAFATWDGEPFAYLKGAWSQDDCNRFELIVGDCRGQAVWEALTILIALRTWREYWESEPIVVRVKSDSKAALGALEKQRSTSPAINAIARELALDRALCATEPVLEFVHVKGKHNEWADALSRYFQPGASPATIPAPLTNVLESRVSARNDSWWRTSLSALTL